MKKQIQTTRKNEDDYLSTDLVPMYFLWPSRVPTWSHNSHLKFNLCIIIDNCFLFYYLYFWVAYLYNYFTHAISQSVLYLHLVHIHVYFIVTFEAVDIINKGLTRDHVLIESLFSSPATVRTLIFSEQREQKS